MLDDLQWADEASQVLLADIVRQLRGTRILLFATCRDTPAQASAASGTLLRLATDANTERVALHGLPTTAVAQLLRAAGLPKDPDQAAGVHQETGGNPFRGDPGSGTGGDSGSVSSPRPRSPRPGQVSRR